MGRRPRLLVSAAIAVLALAVAGCEQGAGGGSLTPQGSGSALTPLVAAATRLADGSRTGVDAAIPVFTSATTNPSENHLQAYTGLGDAHMWMVLNGGGGANSANAALTAYTAAVAAATQRDSAGDLAKAYVGKARALLTVERNTPPQTGPNRVNYLALAIAEYQNAINTTATELPEWHYELARAYERAGNPTGAIGAYRAGAALQPNTTAAVEALLQVALLQDAGNPIPASADADQVLQTLRSAASDNPTSAAARAALGRRYFQRADYSSALTEFQAAVLPSATASSPAFKADASYFLSVLGMRAGSGVSAAQVVRYAEDAISNSGGGFQYRRQVCLAEIAQGGEDFEDGDSATSCQLGDDAQAHLITGLYHLRFAQYRTPNSDINNAETQRWIRDLTTARDEFTRARELATSASATTAQRTIDWAALSQPLATTDAADFGASMVIYCAGSFGALFGASPTVANQAVASEFYSRYQLNDCAAN